MGSNDKQDSVIEPAASSAAGGLRLFVLVVILARPGRERARADVIHGRCGELGSGQIKPRKTPSRRATQHG